MKKILLIVFILLMPLIMKAETIEINGIYYNLISKIQEAEVTSNPNKYSGDITIPEKVIYNDVEYNVTSIGNYAFSECRSLTSVIIPSSVISISEKAFYCCNSLNSITIPDKVISIGRQAFAVCSSLVSVKIPSSVTFIGASAFQNCKNLMSVYISDLEAWCNIEMEFDLVWTSNPFAYAHHLYLDDKEIIDLVIPDGITSIRDHAFFGCSSLNSVTIPSSVDSISNYAFQDCSSLTSVNIPNSVTTIGQSAFHNCSSLTSVNIPNSVTTIGQSAFNSCSSLTSVNIPNSVTIIGVSAFRNCSSLTSVNIPNSVTSIGQSAFNSCSSLTSVNIPNSVEKIEGSAFSDCNGLKMLTIGRKIIEIGSQAFNSCEDLTDVYCYAENVPSTYTDAFKDSYIEYATLHVPAASVEAYRSAEPWKNFKQIVAIDGETPHGPESKKCATPTITYSNKKLNFYCETEGVEFISEIKDADAKKYYDSSVTLDAIYEISVYSTKSGYDNSDVVTATLIWTDAIFTVNSTTSSKTQNMRPLLIQTCNGSITISGATDGERISVYTTSGTNEASCISSNSNATLKTHIKPGDIAIVKIGSRSVKVLMK